MLFRSHHPPDTTLDSLIEKGALPKEWRTSDDPNRQVPLLLPQSKFLIVVAGDPLRNRSLLYRQNFSQGYATSKKVRVTARK